MKEVKLIMLDAHNFVYHMVKMTNDIHYIYENQIKLLIDYTKHYFDCNAPDDEISEIFKITMKNLGW